MTNILLAMLATIRIAQVSGGVVTATVILDDSLLPTFTPAAGQTAVDVTARPDATLGSTVTLQNPLPACAPGCVFKARAGDTFAPPVAINNAAIAAQLTAVEWASWQTRIAGGDTAAAAALAVLLTRTTTAQAAAALSSAATSGIVTPARATAITAALLASASTP